jgi:prevent-host-death family protein
VSRLLKRVAAGVEIIIAKGSRPVARLVPFAGQERARELGFASEQIRIADDFDALPLRTS